MAVLTKASLIAPTKNLCTVICSCMTTTTAPARSPLACLADLVASQITVGKVISRFLFGVAMTFTTAGLNFIAERG